MRPTEILCPGHTISVPFLGHKTLSEALGCQRRVYAERKFKRTSSLQKSRCKEKFDLMARIDVLMQEGQKANSSVVVDPEVRTNVELCCRMETQSE